jgi:SAM-dependent methyltransferase
MSKGWDSIFRRRGRVFTGHHPQLPQAVKLFKRRGARRVLDLGCGTGRHVVYLARHGFEVHGFDISSKAVQMAKQWLEDEKLVAEVRTADMVKRFPYRDRFFDVIVSTNVINHNKIASIRKTIQQMGRVLKPRGFVFITLPSHLPTRMSVKTPTLYKHVEPNTFLPMDGEEKGVLHHIFQADEIQREFKRFRILSIRKDRYDHWCVLMQKKG